MSIKVVDLQNEEVEEHEPKTEIIEETASGALGSDKVRAETKEEVKEEIKEEQPKAKPRAKPKASDIVTCDKCDKAMTYKNLRYSHNCDPKPVKKQANPKGKAKPKPKQLSQGESSLGQSPKPIRAQDRIITCPKCNKSMKMKSYRYSHEQNCKGNLSERPVKKHTNPRPKQQPKPKPVKPTPQQVYYSDDEQDEQPTKPLIKNKQPPQPINHISALAQHYQLLQNEFIKQKQERYNNLCLNMFSSKTKKR